MTGRRLLVLLAAGAAIGAAGALAWRARPIPSPPPGAGAVVVGSTRLDVPEAERAPQGVRIRVQVLNATRTRGLARRATQVLRDRGFDVVGFGNADALRDSTLVLDLSGHPDWAERVAGALGGAGVEHRPDSSGYLDVTVLVGAAWRPPSEPFYP